MQTSSRHHPRTIVRAVAAAATLLLLGTTGAAYAALPHGVDTSHYQHGARLRWQAVKATGVKFAFLKATEGSTYTDPKFATDWAATRQAGIYHGAYHFARPSYGSARRQARHFARVIGPQRVRGTLPPVLDLEATGGLRPRPLITWTRAWLRKVTQLTGRRPIIYTSPLFWRDHLHNSAGFHAYPLWVAHYGVRAPMIPGHWPTWSFWQSTSAARITGISGRVDRDVFNGSLAQLQKFALAFDPSPTKLTVAVSNPAPMTGQRVAFTGTLTDSAGRPVGNRPVTLLRRQPGSTTWSEVGSVRTGRRGFYRIRTVVASAGTYRTAYAGETDFRPSASTVARVKLTPAPTVLSLDPIPDQAYAGSTATLTGSLHRAGGLPLAGQHVTLSRQVAGRTAWRVLARLTTDGAGTFRTTVRLMKSASYRAEYAANPTYAGSASPTTTDTVLLNATTLSFRVSNPAPFAKHHVRMRGALVSGAVPVARRTITLSRLLPGSTKWETVGSVTTDATGHFLARPAVDRAGSYRAVFGGDALYATSSASPVEVSITPPTRTTLALSPHSAQVRVLRRGRSTHVSGRLRTTLGEPIVGRTVRLWKRVVGTRAWYPVARTVTVGPRGTWHLTVQPTHSCWFRAAFGGGTRFASSHSPRTRVNVTAPRAG